MRKDQTTEAEAVEFETGPAGAAAGIKRLIGIMTALRDREHGCPWDCEQTFATIAPYTIEEAYEVADAIERRDWHDLKDELGDLLLQVVYHARMAEEQGLFAFADVADAICSKMIRRHPHVFGEDRSGDGGPHQWEAIKAQERAAKNAKTGETPPALFDDIPAGLPALAKSLKLQHRAARIGFDWPALAPILDKVDEELAELRAEISPLPCPDQAQRQFEEFGDLMFVMVNLGRRLGIDAEAALRSANMKFTRRMRWMADAARENGQTLETMTLDEMEKLWDGAKADERKS